MLTLFWSTDDKKPKVGSSSLDQSTLACTAASGATGRLLIAKDLPQAPVLVEELVNFEVRLSASGHDTYGAARESVHDDLVLALACAVWVAARHRSADADRFLTLR